MTTKSTTPSLAVNGKTTDQMPVGNPTTVFQKGVEAYDALKLGSEVNLTFDDGTTRKAVVQSTQVGALIDLLSNFGPQSIYSYGQIYSPRTLVQTLTTAAGEQVLDVTKLYTAVVVTVPIQPPSA